MSFINNLGKGFVKSAVNQVGRDAGRQVSNAVFSETAKSKKGDIVSVSELQPVSNNIFWNVIGMLIVSAFPFLGGFLCVIQGIMNLFFIDYKEYFRIEKHEVYVPDRRFKTGKRLDGHRDVKVFFKGEIDRETKNINMIKGIIYIIIGVVSIGLYFYVINEYVAP